VNHRGNGRSLDLLRETQARVCDIANAHSGLVGDPPPQAVFVGFGDSSINFELRAWTDEFGTATRIRTDLAAAAYDGVKAAAMSFGAKCD
jgi:potassium efflux system protein